MRVLVCVLVGVYLGYKLQPLFAAWLLAAGSQP